MPKKKTISAPTTAAPVSSYKHNSKRRRIPTQEESVKLSARQKQPVKTKYDYDPSLDPQLIWSGKKEQGAEFEAPTVPIYVQEKIAPEAIIARLKTGASDDRQMLLFGETAEDQFHKAVDFYRHEDNWQNRMILGDSLLVMNSLLQKEGMRGKVQTIYIDPPYGIRFGSNWQPSTRSKDVRNRVQDLVRQPEQVKAFRDTWELGIHSYLAYLRDRLLLARELLNDSGSCFVQISDENVHLVRSIIDEVFDSSNFVALITFQTAANQNTNTIQRLFDHIVWYARSSENVKVRKLYRDRTEVEIRKMFTSKDEDGKYYRPDDLGPMDDLERERLRNLGRLTEDGLRGKLFADDFPATELHNVWLDTVFGHAKATEKIYAVQTNKKVIERCLLLTTDPGDLVFDPTCGSGTTAYVAEQWGRRWITVDTSRVALALARTRLMTARYPYYRLKNDSSLSDGFHYQSIPRIRLKALADELPAVDEPLYDKPRENPEIVRVAGPFTVESLSPHRVSDAQEMVSTERFVNIVIENLLRAGVQTGEKGARVEFENLDILPSGPEVQAVGEYKTKDGLKKVAVAIGPEFGSVDDDFIRDAITVAKRFADLLVVAATSFEASAHSMPAQVDDLRVMKVKINPDLSMGDLLKKTGSGNLFLAFGEPEIKVKQTKEGVVVEVVGVDIYDPVKSEIRSSGSGDPEHDIAAWFIDTNYNGEAFFVTHAYFLGADKPYEKLKKALKADINEELWDELYSTTSRPFLKPKTGKIAVKVINHYGDEVMKVVNVR